MQYGHTSINLTLRNMFRFQSCQKKSDILSQLYILDQYLHKLDKAMKLFHFFKCLNLYYSSFKKKLNLLITLK